jgi:IclR family transcriptional regulator, KDG regulon repressor
MPQKQSITLKKSLDILELFAKNELPLNVKDLSQQSGLPESTIYRYISTLAQRDFIEYDPSSQKYRLGMKLIRLGYAATRQLEIHRVAYPIMEDLASKSGETVLLTLKKGISAIVVEVVESSRGGIKLAMNRGDTLPLYSCALARPLMAYLSDKEIDCVLQANPPKRFTEHTITNVQEIKSELKRIKRHGYAYSDQEVTIGARGLGSPIFNYSGAVIATLCLAGSLHHITKPDIPRFLKLLMKATEECSLKMGFKS